MQIKEVNLFAKEQLAPEFISINPQHCVPTIDDGGFYLWESRGELIRITKSDLSRIINFLFRPFAAIAQYLVEAKAPRSSLLPSSPAERALVYQRLYFDAGTLYPRVRAIAVSASTRRNRLSVNDKVLLRVAMEKVSRAHMKLPLPRFYIAVSGLNSF